jgi:hypothetical protein
MKRKRISPRSSQTSAFPAARPATLSGVAPAFYVELHDAECAWVPGTTDRVRFTLLRQGQKKVRELAVARLAVMFGRALMDDLYLKGRARLRLSEGQLLELA